MTYSVHQHWDPLRVCAVGQSYPPEFYDFISNIKIREIMQRIASETEEDYQKLIKVLQSFNVEIIRPTIDPNFDNYFDGSKFRAPFMMTPRDYTAMIGEKFFMPGFCSTTWYELEQKILAQGNTILHADINTAMTTRIGKDLYFGTDSYTQNQTTLLQEREKLFPDYRCHIVNTGGHSDGTFCPVVPGLIVSLADIPTYANTFPGWEVIYLRGQSWSAVKPFLRLKEKNRGKWWVPGEEFNDEFTNFVESWLGHWVGYVEETVFDVNMLVIDEKNVVCNNYNEKVFEAFSRYGITPHVVNFRHRYFWDGGLHCITSDIYREGTQKDYFPERVLT